MNKTNETANRKLTIRMSDKTYQVLVEVSKAEQRSVNSVMNRMINIYSKMYHSGVVKKIGEANGD
jgi:predicted HicB family RNase H-like nuclease